MSPVKQSSCPVPRRSFTSVWVHTSCDGAEPLLPGGIPNLKLNTLAIELDGTDLEVDADGGDEGRGEGVVREAEK
ncbi:hypothetical protein BC936DRAFT_140003 [Jimgerdemannia flammicorona]|uniref:Uncharacterized protein n=1 Tax=Jimgerdemannia flammicorona TaxID=994334 RepID=A0A433B7K2_9FUNG|nr:hypothetical protein BC936DRAFT_140003 [Jimgerdemannia flammicorona]